MEKYSDYLINNVYQFENNKVKKIVISESAFKRLFKK